MKLRFIGREIEDRKESRQRGSRERIVTTRVRKTRVLQYYDEDTGQWTDVPYAGDEPC